MTRFGAVSILLPPDKTVRCRSGTDFGSMPQSPHGMACAPS